MPVAFLIQPFRRQSRWLRPKPKLLQAPIPINRALAPVYRHGSLTASEKSDLRYWAIWSSGYSECRACHAIKWNNAERRFHIETSRCALTLVSAYKLLLMDMKCVVCDKKTRYAKYGVPLCKECVSKFETTGHLPAIAEATKLVGRVQ